jgi:hypothetical protein
MNAVFRNTLAYCVKTFRVLEATIPAPVQVPEGNDFSFQYDVRTPHVVVVQKLARIITGLNAVLILNSVGLYQEVGAMLRMLDEFGEDVSFMCDAIRAGKVSDLQQRFMDEFFQPEFDHENPLKATQKRDRVPRDKIQAALARQSHNPVNPSDSQKVKSTITKSNSGYVHGASGHILEMYGGGGDPGYELQGMLNTRRQVTSEELAWTYVYRGLLGFMEAAGAFGETELLAELFSFRAYYERTWGKTDWPAAEKLVKDMKATEPPGV